MQRFDRLARLCLDAAAALLYTASIAIALASVALIGTQKFGFAVVIAALSFFAVAVFHGRRIWQRHGPALLA
jgi:hypothetical protein